MLKQPVKVLTLPELDDLNEGKEYTFDGIVKVLVGPPVTSALFTFLGGYDSRGNGVWSMFQNPDDLEDVQGENALSARLTSDPDGGEFSATGKYAVASDLSQGYVVLDTRSFSTDPTRSSVATEVFYFE